MRGNSEESRRPTQRSPKNEEFFWIAYMDRPHVGGVWLVDWCTRQSTRRALRTKSCSRLHPCMVHAWYVFDWCNCGTTHRAIKTRSRSELNFFSSKNILVLLSPSVERFGVSRMRDFCWKGRGSYPNPKFQGTFQRTIFQFGFGHSKGKGGGKSK